MKKVLLLLLCLTTLICLFAVNVQAADEEIGFEIKSVSANRGDSVEVEISLTKNPGITFISFNVEYDQTVLQLESITDQKLFSGASLSGSRKITDYPYRVTVSDYMTDYTNTGSLVVLKFKVLDNATFGDSSVKVVKLPKGDLAGNIDDEIFSYPDSTEGKFTVICPHTNKTLVEAKEATCTEDGNEAHYACPDCKKNFEDEACTKEIEEVVIPALGHKITHHDAVAATCTVKGNVEYYSCEQCGKNFADEEGKTELEKIETEMISHTPGEYKYDANVHWQVCSVCGNEIEGTREAHNESEPETVPATCTEPKKLGATHCTICGMEMKAAATEGEPLGHKEVKTDAKAPTCTEAGNIDYWYCDQCGEYFSDAACTTVITKNDTVVAALGHNMTHHDAVAATCTAKGNVEYYYCDGCKKNFADVEGKTELTTIETEMIPHTESEWMTDAEGHWKECTVCHNIVVAKVKHTPGDPESHTAATCTEPERNGAVHCTECGYLISEGEELNPALGHDKVHHEYKDSTCTELGNNEYWECARCGKYYSDEACTAEITIESTIIQMKEHTYTEHAEDPADHHKAGVKKYYTCDVCGKVFDADKNETTLDALVIPQIPHDTITVWTSDDDNHWHLCSCGDKLDVAAHEEEVRDYQAPTCTEDGCEGGVYCKICNRLIKAGGNVIPALGHDLVEVPAVAATCTTDGNIQYWHCNTCGVNYADPEGKTVVNSVVVSKLGHDFKDGTCTRCGAEDPNYATYPSYVIVDDHYHATFDANHIMIYSVHTPSMFGVQSDGIYQWNICSVCGAAFNKTLINKTENPDDVTVNEGDQTEDINIEEPVESNTPDEEEETTVVEEPTPVEDTNPKTGVTISLFAVVAAACAVVLGKKR